MNRIFSVLATVAMACLLVAFGLGYGLKFVGDIHDPSALEAQRWKNAHLLFGVATSLVIVLVHSIVITYFIGTSRWCKEVARTYKLDPATERESMLLKRRTFPWALSTILLVLCVLALGAAADPSAAIQRQPARTVTWGEVHLVMALAAVGFATIASVIEWNNIVAHQRIIRSVLEDVQRIRAERGLESNDAGDAEQGGGAASA